MSIGTTLAEARRQAGLTVSQVSQQTRIRESIIRAIEQGDFSASGGDFYARGHIRSIATAVGEDPAPLIAEYDADHGAPGGISAAEVFEPSAPIKISERRSPVLMLIVVVVLLGVIGYAGYHLATRNSGGKRAAASVTTTRASSPTPTPKVTAVQVKSKPSPTRHPARPAVTLSKITITAAQRCWVLLSETGSGKQLYMGVIPAGRTKRWSEKHEVTLELGNPPGVNLFVDGHRTDTNVPQVLTFLIKPGKPAQRTGTAARAAGASTAATSKPGTPPVSASPSPSASPSASPGHG